MFKTTSYAVHDSTKAAKTPLTPLDFIPESKTRLKREKEEKAVKARAKDRNNATYERAYATAIADLLFAMNVSRIDPLTGQSLDDLAAARESEVINMMLEEASMFPAEGEYDPMQEEIDPALLEMEEEVDPALLEEF